MEVNNGNESDIFQFFVSPSSTHLNIIACANYVMVFQKWTLIEWLNGYIIFLCIYYFSSLFIFISLKHPSLFLQRFFSPS